MDKRIESLLKSISTPGKDVGAQIKEMDEAMMRVGNLVSEIAGVPDKWVHKTLIKWLEALVGTMKSR